MLSKPFDIVVIFALMVGIIATIQFGVTAVIDSGATVGDTSFFTTANDTIDDGSFFKGTVDNATEPLSGQEGSTQQDSEQNILTQGLQSLRDISLTYKATEKVLNEGTSTLSIPPVYLTLVTGVIIIIMFVLVYTWARGSK